MANAGVDPAEELRTGVQHGDDLAVDIELELFGGGVADPDRCGAFVTGEVVEVEFGQAPLPADSIHDLNLRRVAGTDAGEEIPEGECLVGVSGSKQRLEGERGVAEPAIAVVPVPHTPDLLGQGGRGRGDHSAGVLRSHRLQCDQ